MHDCTSSSLSVRPLSTLRLWLLRMLSRRISHCLLWGHLHLLHLHLHLVHLHLVHLLHLHHLLLHLLHLLRVTAR